jgi:hypothetical protein
MRRLVLVLVLVLWGLLLMQVSARAEDPSKDAKQRVDQEAERVWLAFGDGVAPAPEVGREARRVLEEFVDALPEAKRAATRLHTDSVDVALAKAAWAAGDRPTAKNRAEVVLDALRKAEKDWDSGNVLHEMHILLGRVALESGDLDEADRQLLRAARTPGSPQLDSFGPDWTLARDLLARGRREAVSAYVLRVGTFWESGAERLAEWKKALADGGTPKFLPERKSPRDPTAPKVRKDFGEPPPLGTPTGLVGFWESTAKSKGGIGNALDFRADGTVVAHMVVLVDGKYRIDGDQLVLETADADEPTRAPLGKVEGDTWKMTAEGETVEKKRVGAATPGAPPLVGVWTYDHYVGQGSKAFERYDTAGWMRFRMLMPGGPDSGTYERKDATVRLTFDAKPQVHTMTIVGDRLRLVSGEDEREYRYVGSTAWYVPAKPAKDEPVK